MKTLTHWIRVCARNGLRPFLMPMLALLACSGLSGPSYADVPGRPDPAAGSVPLPGNQQQELANITFPAPYNVFEFVVTCMACHGGSIDQQAAHGGNWAGTNMASAARDPVFRAHQILVNSTVKNQTGEDGAGNMCWRCHSPNGWLSGRFDPKLGGAADGSDMIQSILLSTDAEGVQCEQCHRAIGAVTMQRPDLNPTDPAWNMMSGPTGEWPHAGGAFPAGPGANNPYGDGTLQYIDAMSYGAKYGGNTEVTFSDIPLTFPGSTPNYTGQTYGIYPWWYTGVITPPPAGMPSTNDLGEVIHYNLDGSASLAFEAGVMPDPLWGAVSPEHSTRISDFVRSPELCGSCHDLTIPVLNHGMPVQRTYTEWKYSAFGRNEAVAGVADNRCQGCHMPTMKHEYTDDARVSLNPDPLLSGWYPYAKDRNIGGGTSFHKLVGGNRDLPQMMKILYPEVDLEVVGAPTGHDPRIFPGMLSDRSTMWDRASRNTEVHLQSAVTAAITNGPTLINATTGRWRVNVRVTNKSGHKIPSGFPAGQRMWLSLVVRDVKTGAVVYQSGHYDPVTAKLYTDDTMTGLNRALTRTINSRANAVMVYEKVTGTCTGTPATSCTPSEDLLNDTILFDNRIPPVGYDYAQAAPLGGAFWSYDPATYVPYEDPGRYATNATTGYRNNSDLVSYTFDAPVDAVLSARVEVNYQSHSREYMDTMVSAMNALPADDQGPRPEGPPSPLAANYPMTPTYLSDSLATTTGADFATLTDLSGNPLQDNWAGVAYAAWLLTGKGAPFLMAAADTAVTAPPAAPTNVTVTSPIDPNTGLTDPNAQRIGWSPVDGADGYRVWIRYGASNATSSWDKLAIVRAPQTELLNLALNVSKTYAYRVDAFNAKGYGPKSLAVAQSTPTDLPLPPINTRVFQVTGTTVTLTWFDQADNEIGFIVERQDVPADRNLPMPVFREVARFSSANPPAFGGTLFTDGTPRVTCPTPPPLDPGVDGCYIIDAVNPADGWVPLEPGHTYNYRISAYNASGSSGPDLPVGATTLAVPLPPTALTAAVVIGLQVDLAWTDNSGNETGFRIERSDDGGTTFAAVGTVGANVAAYADSTALANTAYSYRVIAFNNLGDSMPSNVATVTTPDNVPASPTGLTATPSDPSPNPPTVTLAWTDNAANEAGFRVERAPDVAGLPGTFAVIATINLPDTTGYVDAAVAPKTTYHYRVSAFNTTGTSLASNVATAVTPGEIPQAPSNLVAASIRTLSIVLTWTDNATNEIGFYVERAPDVGGTPGAWARVATLGVNAVRAVDAGLTRRTTYWYRVQAFNADGVSEYSNVIVARTL